MLQPERYVPLDEVERQVFARMVPAQHFLLRLGRIVDFERFRPTLAQHYAPLAGRPALDPVMMLKLDFLSIHHRWSDRELMQQVQVNVAHRLFLDLGSAGVLPHPTSMTYFRERVGAEALQEIFQDVLVQARELKMVKDRLRLKDATHLIANIAVPSTIRLLAQMREQVLDAAEPFAADFVAAESEQVDVICAQSEKMSDTERLELRVALLRRVLLWADELPDTESFRQGAAETQAELRRVLKLAHKVLADRESPKASDKVISIHDADARCGKHGEFFDGYLTDVTMDADSELITGINVLPANGDEGGDAAQLIRQEEAAHGNDVAAISIDGAGYRGPVLRELTDPAGLNLEVFTPPTERIPLTVFAADAFTRSEDGKTLTCPAGQTTSDRQRNKHDSGVKFRFSKKQCAACPLRAQCIADPTSTKPSTKPTTKPTTRRTVIKNDYEAEYKAAQAKAQTPAYQAVRKEHPAIERKLSELVRRHDLRHARYRGLTKVLRQALLTAVVVNLKRMVRLRALADRVIGPPPDPSRTGTLRAEVLTVG
jgi:transposase